jgi:hypothetical protein
VLLLLLKTNNNVVPAGPFLLSGLLKDFIFLKRGTWLIFLNSSWLIALTAKSMGIKGALEEVYTLLSTMSATTALKVMLTTLIKVKIVIASITQLWQSLKALVFSLFPEMIILLLELLLRSNL